MKFASVRIATRQFEKLLGFYQAMFSVEPRRLADGFAEIPFDGAVLAISDESLIQLHNNGLAVAASNRSAILEFQVDDVEAVLSRVDRASVAMPVTVMPWGNTSLLLRDPDGNLVNVFSRPSN
ncbi:VOC family protein [Luteibacter anthropi]|uniref:VOC family protein n=1 Tax=Luteibacter anthropi TaxID=564369 RepID=UPI00203285D7|nr:VOC family protein [Luteibacter anthropi]URX62533.1 VOC family protein [Luteibacter anthropi]